MTPSVMTGSSSMPRCKAVPLVRAQQNSLRRGPLGDNIENSTVSKRRRKWCPGAESNHRHCDFQSHALPTELPGHPCEARRASVGARRYRGMAAGCPADKRSCRPEIFAGARGGGKTGRRRLSWPCRRQARRRARAREPKRGGRVDATAPATAPCLPPIWSEPRMYRQRDRAGGGIRAMRPAESPDPSMRRSAARCLPMRERRAFSVSRAALNPPRRAASAPARSRPAARPGSRNCP